MKMPTNVIELKNICSGRRLIQKEKKKEKKILNQPHNLQSFSIFGIWVFQGLESCKSVTAENKNLHIRAVTCIENTQL